MNQEERSASEVSRCLFSSLRRCNNAVTELILIGLEHQVLNNLAIIKK
jgi:hypothetical protein